jgi:signal transduction histidine kinase
MIFVSCSRRESAGRLLTRIMSEVAMTDSERLKKLRHDLSNPLSAMLAEVQLLLLSDGKLDEETRTSLREVEAMAIRMRGMLREL